MDGRLLKIELTQSEMYDLGNFANITHHVLYDPTTRIGVDITAAVAAEPLLSATTPYDLFTERETQLLEDLLSDKQKPFRDEREARYAPCVVGFKAEELVGEE
jgi:hypothetical protein